MMPASWGIQISKVFKVEVTEALEAYKENHCPSIENLEYEINDLQKLYTEQAEKHGIKFILLHLTNKIVNIDECHCHVCIMAMVSVRFDFRLINLTVPTFIIIISKI